MKWGYGDSDWAAAKAEMVAELRAVAAQRSMVSYSRLVDRVQAIRFEPDSYAFHAMLGEISSEEHAAGRGMLSVIVVHKDGDMEPGPGFYNLAKELGLDPSDRTAFWVSELHRVHSANEKLAKA
jgi:hypothetical protein